MRERESDGETETSHSGQNVTVLQGCEIKLYLKHARKYISSHRRQYFKMSYFSLKYIPIQLTCDWPLCFVYMIVIWAMVEGPTCSHGIMWCLQAGVPHLGSFPQYLLTLDKDQKMLRFYINSCNREPDSYHLWRVILFKLSAESMSINDH